MAVYQPYYYNPFSICSGSPPFLTHPPEQQLSSQLQSPVQTICSLGNHGHILVNSIDILQIWVDHVQTLGQTLVTTAANSSKLITPSLSLSANSIIWSTSALEKCSPTEAATFQNSSGPKAPVPDWSKASKTVWRVASLVESPPKPKMSTKVPKSNSPVTPAALTMEMIWLAWSPRLSALTVLTSSSMEMLPLPSQSKTSKTSLSLVTVSAVRFFLTYLEGSKAGLVAGLDIRYFRANKKQ